MTSNKLFHMLGVYYTNIWICHKLSGGGFKSPRHGNFPLGFLESTVRGGGVDVPPISIKWAKTVVFGEKIPFSETDCPLRGGTLLFR